MSSCGDCGTDEGGCGSCGPSRPVQAPKTLPGLIQFGLEHWNEESYSDPYKAKHWDLLFNVLMPFSSTCSITVVLVGSILNSVQEIGVNLAKKNAQSTKPLLTVFSEQGPRAFLQLAQQLLLLELEGKLIWWAFEFCLEDPTEFVKQINNRNPTLLRYAHQQANIYSCFPGLSLLLLSFLIQ